MSISEVRVDDIHVIRGISLRHVELHWADPYCHFLFFHFIPSLFRSRGEAQEEHGVGYEPSGGNVEDFAPLSERLLWKKTGIFQRRKWEVCGRSRERKRDLKKMGEYIVDMEDVDIEMLLMIRKYILHICRGNIAQGTVTL